MSWADLTDLVNTRIRDTFGVAVTYTPASTAVAESITAVFDAQALVVEMGGEVGQTATRPMLTVRTADLSVAPKKHDTLTIGAQGYKVTKVDRGDSGDAVLWLIET